MDFQELINKRYSTRSYKEAKLRREEIAQIIEAGRLAPSAANRQPWRFVVVDEEPLLGKVRTVYDRKWFREAPAIIIAYGDYEEAWQRSFDGKNHCDIDVGIAVDHMTLMAADLGIGTCWVCHFNPILLNKIIIPTTPNWQPIALLSVGYPADTAIPKNRKATEAIVRYNAW